MLQTLLPEAAGSVAVAVGGFVVGILGGVLGVGGGVFLVPFLVLVAALRPVAAVGVSLCCVIGTSAASAPTSLRSGNANLALALFLEPFLVVGAAIASASAHRVADRSLLIAFSALLGGIVALFAWQAARPRTASDVVAPTGEPGMLDGVVDARSYRPQSPARLAIAAGAAGVASGLFGVGGGVLIVPALGVVGRVPLRAAAATSTLALMTTATAGAIVHLAHGTVPPDVVAASLVGVLPGGLWGARLQRRIPERAMRIAFVVLGCITIALTLQRALS